MEVAMTAAMVAAMTYVVTKYGKLQRRTVSSGKLILKIFYPFSLQKVRFVGYKPVYV